MSLFNFGVSFWLFLICLPAAAYPEFIGYGYTTCITCHFNSNGNGALTDYGRALFSQEIAARPWVSKALSDEDLATLSSFIPGVELPYWFRPSAKYRGLYLERAPTSSMAQYSWINMQMELGATLSWDRGYKTIFSFTYNNLQVPRDYYGNEEEVSWVLRDYYLRTYLTRSILFSVGLMDKVYGLRTVDHTAYNRQGLGFGQENQAHGIVLQWLQSQFDFSVNYFVGNLQKNEKMHQKGFSFQGEYEVASLNRFGMSGALFENTAGIEEKLFALHHRMGFEGSKGTSLLGELGFVEKNVVGISKLSQGVYGYLEALVNLTRGYNFYTSLERVQESASPGSPDRQRWAIGLWTFPFQRVEIRGSAVQQKAYNDQGGEPDAWMIQGQVHVSM
ncbi:hypothetical protein AZI86_10765 [Bdellovibrio bacteriovorus]|uniref:Uncharacterized protein n=1 Tax=Bdellovibrio bacteriovorus TaxID=959 RepID=A0A150WLH6_BDEBC|nr:hypothetical protein [Bdellovibrio bacteriovorus]KYG64685.1 hypothetical protein AZI86_10765 [Bdellovibrio bacteriovorus]